MQRLACLDLIAISSDVVLKPGILHEEDVLHIKLAWQEDTTAESSAHLIPSTDDSFECAIYVNFCTWSELHKDNHKGVDTEEMSLAWWLLSRDELQKHLLVVLFTRSLLRCEVGRMGMDKVLKEKHLTWMSLGRNGGLALLWKDDANVTISNFSQHHIDLHVSSANGKWWRFTGFYGHPKAHRRHESWALLDKLQSLSMLPWLCVGDFNETLSQEEHMGVHARALPRILAFSEVVNRFQLEDLSFRGGTYTWDNYREDLANVEYVTASSGSALAPTLPYDMARCRRQEHQILSPTSYLSRRTNKIEGLSNSNGQWCTDGFEIGNIAIQYFEDIFGSSYPHCMDETLSVVPSVVSEGMNHQISIPYLAEEVRQALFDMPPSKAPGPNVLNSGHLLRKVNLTNIALIPKRKNPDKMSDFRPISLFFETLNSLRTRRSGKKAYMALKLDMSKAYDRVEWRFLELIMHKLGFANNWVNLIKECIQSVTYSGVTSLIRQAELDGHISGVATYRRGLKVSHLLFADDSLLFCKATISNSTKIMEILSLYEHSSGQKINREKSAIFFSSNTPQPTRDVIYQFEGWKEKFLSKAGHEVLIKAIAQAIPTYSMNCFLLPKSWCSDVDGLIAKYWWGQTKNERKIHWVKWDKLYRRKFDGGLGFKNLHLFNLALLAKQGCQLLQAPHILAGRKVLVNRVVWKPSVTCTTRAIWNAILSASPAARFGGNFGSSSSQLKLNTFSGEPTMTLYPHISIFIGGRLETRRCALSAFRMLKQSHTSYAESSDGMSCDLMGNLECMELVHL
uniref:Reverse transcriptase domain-containing protein n=1 Tax=Fagus sylvatica TaxID=28930 RepID=A0A2N9HP17_FAGSY